MQTILNNVERLGNFTSSKIAALMTNGKAAGTMGAPAFTYIEEKNMERRLGRSLTDEVDARPLTWGKLGEKRVFDMLPPAYVLIGDESFPHPEIEGWSGSPDVETEDTSADVKCPKTLKSFCQLLDPYIKDGKIVHPGGTIEAVRENHKEGDTYYWQIVSNACIRNKQFGELIVYCPYKSELQDLRDIANTLDGEEMIKYYWVINSQDEELPHLIEGKHYKNLNIIRFEIPQADKDFLKERVLKGKEYLINV